MYTIEKITQNIVKKINTAAGAKIAGESDLTMPPNPAMGDFSFACFNIAKSSKKSPADIAMELAAKIKPDTTLKEIKAVGPYVNFTLQPNKFAQSVLTEIKKDFGKLNSGKKKKIIVEYACPNVNKAFHIGHLRNIITGEAIIRLLENAGYKVIRVNYQGDVGMHIAKSIWGILRAKKEFVKMKKAPLEKRIAFLGKTYAAGAKAYEENEQAKAEMNELNQRIYHKDRSVMPIWKIARQWSLQYFEAIYKRVHSRFDYYFFESEMAARGVEIVKKNANKGIFKKSEGAIIFPGGEHGLHDRVFINSVGFPTYEGKDLALAELWFKKFKPALAIHVVGKEQTEYFKVVFKALEYTLPASKNKELHVAYGWVHLKGGKMSSRLGNVVTGEDLLTAVGDEVKSLSKQSAVKNKNKLVEDITLAAVKYAMLKGGVAKDIAFDMEESVSLSGNSGPYLLYTYARIRSILKKIRKQQNNKTKKQNDFTTRDDEKQILLKLALFPEITKQAAEQYDPSLVAKYLFELAKAFNDYYHRVPVLKAKPEEKVFRLALISAVASVLKRGAELLGFDTVDRM
jgi:arginyl-tRNA synthetase